MKRYYNLKEGNKEINWQIIEINWQIIEINLDNKLENRVKNFFYDTKADLLEYKNNVALYKLNLNEQHSLVPILESNYSMKKKKYVEFSVSDKGEIKIRKTSGNRVYLEEISQKKAKEIKQAEKNWRLQQAWIAE